MKWPEYFPEKCPPENAEPTTGEFYRLTKGRTPNRHDFIPYYELHPNREYPSICIACGLSIYANVEDIFRLMRRVPATKKKSLAKGFLTKDHGQVLNTPSYEKSHHTWWLKSGIEPWTFFSPVDG